MIVKKNLGRFDFASDSSRRNLEIIRESGNSSNTLDDDNNETSAEVHDSKSLQFVKDDQPRPRKRIHTLELDLSCTKNRFPIKHQLSGSKSVTSPTDSEGKHSESFKSLLSPVSLSSYSFAKPLYCEQRLLSSKSEAMLSKDRHSQQLDNQPSTSSSTHWRESTEAKQE